MRTVLQISGNPDRHGGSGFTLLEVTLSIGLMALLAAGIYSLAAGSVELSAELVEYQDREALRRKFLELCRFNLENLPAHAKLELTNVDSGAYYTSYLSVEGDPSAFASASRSLDVSRVILASEVESSGFTGVFLYYLDARQNEAWTQGQQERVLSECQRFPLVGRLRQATWRFYDRRRKLWVETWKAGRENPPMVSLLFEMEGDAAPERLVFWVPENRAAPGGNSLQKPAPDGEGDGQTPGQDGEQESRVIPGPNQP